MARTTLAILLLAFILIPIGCGTTTAFRTTAEVVDGRTGVPIADASVQAMRDDRITGSSMTDRHGIADIDVPQGGGTWIVNKNGYEPFVVSICKQDGRSGNRSTADDGFSLPMDSILPEHGVCFELTPVRTKLVWARVSDNSNGTLLGGVGIARHAEHGMAGKLTGEETVIIRTGSNGRAPINVNSGSVSEFVFMCRGYEGSTRELEYDTTRENGVVPVSLRPLAYERVPVQVLHQKLDVPVSRVRFVLLCEGDEVEDDPNNAEWYTDEFGRVTLRLPDYPGRRLVIDHRDFSRRQLKVTSKSVRESEHHDLMALGIEPLENEYP